MLLCPFIFTPRPLRQRVPAGRTVGAVRRENLRRMQGGFGGTDTGRARPESNVRRCMAHGRATHERHTLTAPPSPNRLSPSAAAT